MAGNLNFKLRIVFWNYFFWTFGDLKNESNFLKRSHLYYKQSDTMKIFSYNFANWMVTILLFLIYNCCQFRSVEIKHQHRQTQVLPLSWNSTHIKIEGQIIVTCVRCLATASARRCTFWNMVCIPCRGCRK